MNHVERFRAVMNFQPVDRLPRWEWAMWWDETIARWHQEGLPRALPFHQVIDIAQYFGLDPYQQFWFSTTDPTIEATQHHVEASSPTPTITAGYAGSSSPATMPPSKAWPPGPNANARARLLSGAPSKGSSGSRAP